MAIWNYEEHPERQHLEIQFQAPRRQPCTATVNLKPCDNPTQDGQHLLDLPYPPDARKDFPAVEMKVHSPSSRGYAAMYGWIQIVAEGNSTEPHGRLPTDLSQAPWTMDPIPITQDLNTPFTWFGVEPSLFDGPSRHGVDRLDWVSRSFLCYLDGAVGNIVTEGGLNPKPILVVEWGFWIDDYRPRVKVLKQPGVEVWNDHLELFRRSFPKWQFSSVQL